MYQVSLFWHLIFDCFVILCVTVLKRYIHLFFYFPCWTLLTLYVWLFWHLIFVYFDYLCFTVFHILYLTALTSYVWLFWNPMYDGSNILCLTVLTYYVSDFWTRLFDNTNPTRACRQCPYSPSSHANHRQLFLLCLLPSTLSAEYGLPEGCPALDQAPRRYLPNFTM